MKFQETAIPGVMTIELEPRGDERGFFARTFCERAFAEAGLQTRMVNTNMSYSRDKHTLRGMHWQQAPSAEVKVVRNDELTVAEIAAAAPA